MRRICWALTAVGLLATSSIGQTVIVDDDFESYTSEAELHAVWAGLDGFASPGTPEEVEEQFELITLMPDNADFNGNNIVDAADYTIWRDHLGAMGTGTQPTGDANHDTNVDQADYDAWVASFGTTPMTGGTGQAVRHLENFIDQAQRLPDGNLVYQPPLDPNFFDGSIFPTTEEAIVLRGDIFVDSGELQRNTIGLRYSTGANLIEMGLQNNTGSAEPRPESGAAVAGSTADCVPGTPTPACAGFAGRVQLFTSNPSNPDWQFFALPPELDTDGNGLVTQGEVVNELGAGWHRLEVTIMEDSVRFTIDLLRDGLNNGTGEAGFDGEMFFDTILVQSAGFDSLRLGGPSGLYTTDEILFDNILLTGPLVSSGAGSLSAVPEPATMSLLLLGVAMFTSRRLHGVARLGRTIG